MEENKWPERIKVAAIGEFNGHEEIMVQAIDFHPDIPLPFIKEEIERRWSAYPKLVEALEFAGLDLMAAIADGDTSPRVARAYRGITEALKEWNVGE